MIIRKSFGLDLGTTNSTAAVIKNGEVIYSTEDKVRKNKIIPSFFAVRRNGSEVVGTIAKNEFYTGNQDSKKSVKRDMGKDIEFYIKDTVMTPEEISSKIISYCKTCLEKTINQNNNVIYDSVVITVPAYFTLAQKDATRKAGELSGLNVQMLLEEPTAAAINFALKNNVENGIFFVFDLGGGTFDVSILEKTGNVPQVLATAGNNFLGGDNFDFLLARYFLNFLEKSGYDISDVEVDSDHSKFKLLMLLSENVKKQLSTQESIDIHYQDIFKDNSVRDLDIENFTRDMFNEIIKEKVEIDIVNECDKALNILKEKNGKTLEDITHIVMVGGSSKIPYIREVIKNKYCITKNLKDITIFEEDLSVSAGAAYIAHSNGYIVEDEEKNIKVQLNAPFIFDKQVYLTGTVLIGKISKIGLNIENNVEISQVNEDKTFLLTIDEDKYSDAIPFIFYDGDEILNKLNQHDDSTIDIIAPTPVQNETITIEIVDIEKGQIEKFPVLKSGATLPGESIEYFKINEYSNEQIKLPVWEGPRKIFDLIIDLPKNTKIGSRLSIKTTVDMISNILLEVTLEGKKLSGHYKYVSQVSTKEDIEKLDRIFDERIKYISDENEKEELIIKKENIDRELKEANANNDQNHYAAVSERFEKVVTEMPIGISIKEEDFDRIGEDIKSKLTKDVQYTKEDIDNLVFYGKRFINRNNQNEAKKILEELEQIKNTVDVFNSPKMIFEAAKIIVLQVIQKALKYVESKSSNQTIVSEINKEFESKAERIHKILNKYDEYDDEEDMKEDAMELIRLTQKLFELVERIAPQNDSTVIAFKGLVSKA